MKDRYHILKRINWDYAISSKDIEAVIKGEQEYAGHWNYDKLLIRMLETLSWYELLEIVGQEQLKKKLVPEILSKLRNSEIQAKYERIGKILRGESVPFTRWNPEYCQKLRDSFFSNRWYST